MTFEEFLRLEEERELKRREERLAKELTPPAPAKPPVKKVDLHALKDRIMADAQKRWEESCKKKYDLSQPLNAPEPWLVFDRSTGELYGEAKALRAYQAWSGVNPTKIVEEKPGKEYLVAIGFNACRCVLRSEWEAAEAVFRKKRTNGVSHAG